MDISEVMDTTDGLGSEGLRPSKRATLDGHALALIASMLPRDGRWGPAEDFRETVAVILDEHGIRRPDHHAT